MARVELPSAWEVLNFGEDFVIILEHDDLKVENARLYGLER